VTQRRRPDNQDPYTGPICAVFGSMPVATLAVQF